MRSQRGAILIHVAIALLALVGFTAFAFDYGVLWLARRQAQNAADAGALAGAVARVFDEQTAPGSITTNSATVSATSHKVFDAPGAVEVFAGDGACPAWAETRGGACVRVNVYRDSAHGNPLDTYFARAFGQTSQDVRAMAVAQVVAANGTDCLKPWMAPDKSSTSTYTVSDIGQLLVIRMSTAPSSYQQADFNATPGVTCQGGGAACYEWSATHCVGGSSGLLKDGDLVNGKPGGSYGKQQGAENIFNQDPDAHWDAGQKRVVDSCAPVLANCNCDPIDGCANGLDGLISPRIVPIGLFDPVQLLTLGNGSLPIRGIAGVFVLKPGALSPGPGYDPRYPTGNPDCDFDDHVVCGYLVSFPGQLVGPGSSTTALNLKPVLVQ